MSSVQSQDTQPDWSSTDWLAPAVSIPMLSRDQTFHLRQDGSGRIVVLKFWATWCAPCIKELPSFASVSSKYRDDDVTLIAINTEEEPATVREFLEKVNLEIEAAIDPLGEAAGAFGVDELPTTVLIDQRGVVQRVHTGFDPQFAGTLSREIDTLLGGETLSPDPLVAAHLHDDKIGGLAMAADAKLIERIAESESHTGEFRLEIDSGQTQC